MKHFGNMTLAEQMKVLLYGELDGEKALPVDPRIRRDSLEKLLPMAKDKLHEAAEVVEDADDRRNRQATYKRADQTRQEWQDIYDEWKTERDTWHKLVVDAEKVLGVEFQGVPMSIINSVGAGQWISHWSSDGCGPKRIMRLLESHGMNSGGFITEEHVRTYLRVKMSLSDEEMEEMR